MSKRILDRYRRDADGKLIIDISASKVEDLYDDFDKQAPYIKKELDYDLVEYLIDSAREIGREPFSVHFRFSEQISKDLEHRVRKSIRNYFSYLQETNRREFMKMLRSSLGLVFLGMTILAVIMYFRLSYNLDESLGAGVLSEGLVIAGWVAVWEGVEAILMSGPSLVRELKLYRILVSSVLFFNADP